MKPIVRTPIGDYDMAQVVNALQMRQHLDAILTALSEAEIVHRDHGSQADALMCLDLYYKLEALL